jgi:general secretion pathway protein I
MTAASRQPSAVSCKLQATRATANHEPRATSGLKPEAWGLEPEALAAPCWRLAAGGWRLAARGARGFTLVEVLVALAIVAVTLLAGLRAVGTMAESGVELRLRLLAQVAAENRIAELRAARAFPGIGSRTVACPQGRMNFECVEETKVTPNPLFRRIEVRVYADAGREHRLAELIGILPNEK